MAFDDPHLFIHFVQSTLDPLAFNLEQLHALQEQLVALPLARALDPEDEVIPYATQLDLVLELWVAQAFSADGVVHGVCDDGFGLAFLALEFRVLLHIGRGNSVETDDAAGEAAREFLGVGADNGPGDVDCGHKAVRGCCYGGELGVVLSDSLNGVHAQIYALTRPHLGDEDVGVGGADFLAFLMGEHVGLAARGLEYNVFGVDVVVDVEFVRVGFAGNCSL